MSDSECRQPPVTGQQPDKTGDENEPATKKNSLEEVLLKELLQKSNQWQQAKKILIKLRHDLTVYRQVTACHTEPLVLINQHQKIIYANPCFCKMTGHGLHWLMEKKLGQLIEPVENGQLLENLLDNVSEQGDQETVLRFQDSDQRSAPVSMTITETDIKGEKIDGFVCRFSTHNAPVVSTEPKEISHYSYDALTCLPDRPSFHAYFTKCLDRAKKEKSRAGLLFIDLDHFKRINQMLGPDFGDKLLCRITEILNRYAREAGLDFVSRLSGDEFAIILPSLVNTSQPGELADAILKRFQKPVTVENRNIYITPSIGISLFPEHGDIPSELLRNADKAMEIAKSRGGNRSCFWEENLDSQAAQNLHLENDLRKAVARCKLINFYQPQIDLTTGKIIGMEALARWEHPEQGIISPVIFIPIAETTGLIDKLCLDLVRLACEEGRKWRDMGYTKFIMAVNISGRLLYRKDLFEIIMAHVESTGFPPTSLELEFTESVLIENMDNTIELINKCRKQGIKLAIDDFGTGYSSLSYLQRLAVDKIKIDRSFIMDVTTNAGDAAITMAIIAIAKKLNFKVLAEGVETEEQLFFLQANQCDESQGFLFSKPINFNQMTSLLMRDSSIALKHKRILDKFFSIKAQRP